MSVYPFLCVRVCPDVRETELHRGIHIPPFVLGLVFVLFGCGKTPTTDVLSNLVADSGVPYLDLLWAVLAVVSRRCIYLLPPEIVAQRVGNTPSQTDVNSGDSLFVLLNVGSGRGRSSGTTLRSLQYRSFFLLRNLSAHAPGALKHGGTSWPWPDQPSL